MTLISTCGEKLDSWFDVSCFFCGAPSNSSKCRVALQMILFTGIKIVGIWLHGGVVVITAQLRVCVKTHRQKEQQNVLEVPVTSILVS